jgi:hypothetical protein
MHSFHLWANLNSLVTTLVKFPFMGQPIFQINYPLDQPGTNLMKKIAATIYKSLLEASVYPWQAFPAKSNVCKAGAYPREAPFRCSITVWPYPQT